MFHGKKVAALAMVCAVSAGMTATAYGAESSYDMRKKAVSLLGIINQSDMNANVTRAEFIKMVMAAMGSKATEAGECFNDVAAEAWYAPYVNAAYFEGLVLGDEKGNFYPEAPITREDMTVILYRALKATAGGSVSFTDEAEISDYAKTAVEYFASNGIVNGLGDGRFGAKENATRAQTAVIIYRILTM